MFLESLQWKLILDLTAPTDLLENEFRLGYLQNIIQVVDSRDFFGDNHLYLPLPVHLFIAGASETIENLLVELDNLSAQSIKYYLVLKYLQL